MSETLSGQLDEFVGEPGAWDRDRRSTVEGMPGQDVEGGEVLEAKPQRRTRSDKGKPRSKHVAPFSTGQPVPGEEPLAPSLATPSVPHVGIAISAITAEIMRIGIGKTHRNAEQKYSFRGIDDVYNVLPQYLVKHGLVILPHVEERTVVERPTRSGGLLVYVNIKMSFDLISTRDGSERRVSSYGEAMDSGDKATNKALSTAYKYMAMQTFCIPTIGIDPEQDDYADEVVGTQQQQPIPPSSVQQQPRTAERQLTAANSTEQQSTAGPSPRHVKLLVELANAKALEGSEAFAAWFRSQEPEDRETIRRERRKTQPAATEARH